MPNSIVIDTNTKVSEEVNNFSKDNNFEITVVEGEISAVNNSTTIAVDSTNEISISLSQGPKGEDGEGVVTVDNYSLLPSNAVENELRVVKETNSTGVKGLYVYTDSSWVLSSVSTGISQRKLKMVEATSALRVVRLYDANTVKVANNSSIDDATHVLGIIINSYSKDDQPVIYANGVVNAPSHGLIEAGIYYLGANGTLTTSAPSTGVFMHILKVLDDNNLLVDIEQPIFRR